MTMTTGNDKTINYDCTLFILKPDVMKMNPTDYFRMVDGIHHTYDVIDRFWVRLTEGLLEELYLHHVGKPYWPRILEGMRDQNADVFHVGIPKKDDDFPFIPKPSVHDTARSYVRFIREAYASEPDRPKHENLLHAPENEEEYKRNLASLLKRRI